jgi:hypothetical protein
MKTVNLFLTILVFCICVQNQGFGSSKNIEEDIRRIKGTVDYVGSSVSHHFIGDLLASTPQTNDKSSMDALFNASKHYRAKFILGQNNRNMVLVSISNDQISERIQKVLNSTIIDISKMHSSKKYALIASTTVSWKEVDSLKQDIDPSASVENAVFWMCVKVKEPWFNWWFDSDKYKQFQVLYAGCLAESFKKYYSATVDQTVSQTAAKLGNIYEILKTKVRVVEERESNPQELQPLLVEDFKEYDAPNKLYQGLKRRNLTSRQQEV